MANEFDDVLDQEPASTLPPLTSGLEKSEFDDVLDTEVTQQQSYVRNVIDIASKDNPQAAAERIQLSQTTGLPPAVVARNQQELKRREMARAIDLQRMMRDSPVLFRQMNDPTFTAAALDDLDTLKRVEGAVAAVGQGARALASGVPRLSQGFAGVVAGGAGVVRAALEPFSGADAPIPILPANPAAPLEQALLGIYQGQADLAKIVAGDQSNAGFVGQAVLSGMESLGQNLPLMAAAVMAGQPELALYSMGASSAGQGYGTAREKGIDPAKAVSYGLLQGFIEKTTEQIPVAQLFKDLGVGAGFWKTLANQLPRELFGEQVATVFQDLNTWAVLNPEKPFSSYVEARGPAAVQTLIATLVGTGGNVAVAKGVDYAMRGAERKVQRAIDDAQRLQNAMAAAARSQLRERAPETFRQLAEQIVAQNEGAESIFIDGQVLQQSGVDIAQMFPSLADKVGEAAFLNATVEIPLAEVLTAVPGTPLEELFLQHAKSAPDALSQAEVQQAGEQGQRFVQDEAERVLQQAQDRQAWQTEVDTVHQTIKGQLDQSGRFTSDVNESYARLQSAFFSTMASRLGITPSEMYERFSLKVAAQMGQGEVLNAGAQFDRDTLAETDAMLEANQLDSVDSAYQYMIDDRSHGDEFLAAAAQILYPGEATGINVREWSAGVVALSNQMIADTNGDPGELDIARYQAGSSALNQSRDITQTPEFKTWFGNSKVVDESGAPLVVYHGTNETFDVFDRKKQREGTWGKGFYFSTSEEEARNYGSNVIAVYLKADRLSDTRAGGPGGTTTGEGKTWAMKGKMLANGGDVFLVTSPTQIKSATGNSGAFDPNDPNVLRQAGKVRTGPALFTSIIDAMGLTKEEAASTAIEFMTGLPGNMAFLPPGVGGIPDVVNFLDERRKASGLPPLDITKPEDRAQLARLVAAEALAHIRNAGDSLEWYDQTINATVAQMAVKYPELNTDPHARTAFLLATAIASQGMNPETNLSFASEQYAAFRTTGTFPETGKGESTPAMADNYRKANELLKEMGPELFRRFLATPFTVKELVFAGFAVGGENMGELVLGSSVFGPKIGFGFFSNLNGNFEPVTMDMWFMRTIGRLAGTLPAYNPDKFANQLQRLRDGLKVRGRAIDGIFSSQFDRDLVQRAKTDQDAAVELARKVKKAHEKDYKNHRADYDSGKRVKSEMVKAADTIIQSMDKPRDVPASGGERQLLRDVTRQVVELVTQHYGQRVPPAALQALIWYPEQELYAAMGVQLAVTSQDYAGAARKLLKAEGFNEQDLDNAARGATESGSGSARSSDGQADTGAARGDDQGARGTGALQADERTQFLINRNARLTAERQAAAARVNFEVAPDPNDETLTARWRQLSQDVRLAISNRVVQRVLPGVLKSLKAVGDLLPQVGSYLDDTNPSFALRLSKGDPAQVAKALGFILSQDSMMALAPVEFDGSFKGAALRVNLGDKTAEEIDQVYQALRKIQIDGRQVIGGQSTSGGVMSILLDAADDAKTVAALVDQALGGEYDVAIANVFAAFPEKQEYDYARQGDDPPGDEGLARQRARDARTQATGFLREELDAVDEEQSRADARVGESGQQTVPVPRDGGIVYNQRASRRGAAPVSIDDVPGIYNARTQLVSAGTRQLGIRRVRTPADAAQALVEYLGTQAVERLDGLVTDKDGKPLAIIGSFKGTVDQSAVYPFTLAGEAFRIEGAAALWFVHNHPSGIPTLSDPDRRLLSTLRDVFDGSGIEPKGMMAIGGKTGGERTFSFTDGSMIDITDVIRPPSKTKTTVPVVERTFAHPAEMPPSSDPRMSDPGAWLTIEGLSQARSVVTKLSNGEFGVVLLDTQFAPIGFLPMDPTQVYPLREQGRSAALFRAISVANASAAIIADTGQGPSYAVENVSRALQSIGIRVIDVLPASGKGPSAAETNTLPAKGRFAQPAYHGTPYRGIDKFSTDKIGTGEGAQAYGWGLYFAGKREIAEYYRETLTPRTNKPVVIWDGYPITYDEINTLPGDDNLILSMVHHLISHGTAGTKQEILNATVVALKEDFSEEAGFTADWQAAVDAIADRIDVEVPNKGQLYEVDIPEDQEMLLWDKPLSEQSPQVREALGQLKTALDTAGLLDPYLAQKNAEWDELTGRELYRQILDRAHSDDALGLFDLGERSDQAASKYLAALGIKGIKYLDGGSRSQGEGSYNYVVFSGDDVAIRAQFYQRQQEARGTFNPQTLLIALGPQSDLSTFLHESGHFFLEVMADLASQPDGPAQIREDMEKVLAWFGVPDLATWNALTLDEKRDHHEKWAESFEQYLLEGKAPSAELQPLFRRYRSWLVNVYRSLSDFMRGRNLELNDEIRQVFDRMLATDEDVKTAEEQAGLLPDFDATNEAIERLQSRSLRALKWTLNARSKFLKQFTKEARERRKGVLAEVMAEFEQRPEVMASRAIRKVRTKDGPERDAAIAAIADATGYATVEEMTAAVTALGPMKVAVEAEVDRRMLERHGDVSTPEALEAAANEAVHNEARARALAAELKSQDEAMNPRETTGRTDARGRPITVNALLEAARAFGADLAARRQIGKLKNAIYLHRAAEARAGKAWQTATQKGDTKAAVQAKKDQLLNNQAVRALLDAQAEVRAAIEFFRKVTKGNNEKLVKGGRDPDVVNAMRAILSAYGIAPKTGKTALEYLELVQKNDPSMYGVIAPGVNSAMARAKPFNELTVEEVRGLTDELKSLWHLAKRSRQMEIDGDLLDLEDLAEQLYARMEDLGIPDVLPGEAGALTDAEIRKRNWLQQAPALLRRVEQWAEAKDGAFGGPFLRFIFQPVKIAADRYRADRLVYRKKFQALVDVIAPTMPKAIIAAPELGYTFGRGHNGIGLAELLHAILHTGNDSNKRKLLLGREWAEENPDGTLDTARWDTLIARLISEGTLTKAHYDFAQGVWDLMEETKPLAQKTHRDVFGRYFAEVTANGFDTPFGSYRGGYVPAQADPLLVQDADQRELLETENAGMSHAFPATNKGFTKGRVEYNRPLKLDLRTLPQHIDKVLLFSHMEAAVRSVDRLLRRKKIAQALNKIDPAAINGMLKPWLNRSARQTVETPVSADAGMNRMLSQARARTGMALMMGNLSNTLQQITGFSTALLKVKGSHMRRAVAQYIADPKQLKNTVWSLSPYMADRASNEVAVLSDTLEAILLNPSVYASAERFTRRHGYFLQTGMDNQMSPIIWTGAYNQALAEGMDDRMARRFADGVIRQTQGSTLPEDVSRIETGTAFARAFTQFIGYFNMLANTNATAIQQIAQEQGLRKGAGKAFGVLMVGMMIPIWVAELIAHAMRGGPPDDEDDGYLDDWLAAVFGFGTIRGILSGMPGIAQIGQSMVNRFNDNPADDKFSLSPTVSVLESAAAAPQSVYKAIADEGSAQKAVRDMSALITLATGLPAMTLARPLGYAAGVAQGKIEPTGPGDFARGMVTGTASPESKTP